MNARFDDWEGEHLAHYGVLGMKWGQRRYQNKDGSLTAAGEKHYQKTGEYGYHYHSHATKKYAKKAAKAEKRGNLEKAAKYKHRSERSAELDKREQEAASKISTGKAILSRMLVGGDMSKAYQQYNAMAGGNAGAATKGVSAVKAWYGGTLGSRAMKAAYIRKGEKDHGLAKRLNDNMEKESQYLKNVDREAKKKMKKYTR